MAKLIDVPTNSAMQMQILKDTITNDLIVVFTFPVVAAVHFLHQNLTYDFQGDSRPLTGWYPEAIMFGASVEAPLMVCENFVIVGVYLSSLACS